MRREVLKLPVESPWSEPLSSSGAVSRDGS
jgi:hypothetical protein